MRLSQRDARRLALRARGLDGGWQAVPGPAGTADVVRRLGYVQIDTISVVARAHHHILWNRQPGYHGDWLDATQVGEQRRVFEAWSWNDTAAYLPVDDYPYYAWHMAEAAASPRRRAWLAEHAALVDAILARIRAEGALASADFEAPPGFKRGNWWDWKPAKRALEHLLATGRLLVAGRRGFQRLYELPDRVIPAALRHAEVGAEEAARFLVRRVAGAAGLAASFGRWFTHTRQEVLDAALRARIEEGEIVPLEVEGVRYAYYALPGALDRADGADVAVGHSTRILSPFDPLLIDRRALRDLFGFDLRLECYLPAEKRRYGYFTVAILWGDTFVGRADVKAERSEGVLRIRNLVLERGVNWPPMLDDLAAAMRGYAAFNGCDAARVEAGDPPAAAEALGQLMWAMS